MSSLLDVGLEGSAGDSSRQVIPSQGLRSGPLSLLELSVWASVANTVSLVGTVYQGGRYYPIKLDAISATDRTAVTVTQAISGVLIGFRLANSGGIDRGQSFAKVEMRREGQNVNTLLMDYVYSGHFPGWPYSPHKDFTEGQGLVSVVSLGNPAPGADYATVTVPTGARWKVRGFAGTLVSAVAAANRQLRIDYDDGANVFSGSVAAARQAASLTNPYRGGIGSGVVGAVITLAAGEAAQLALGDVFLEAGYRISFVTNLLQAADDWGPGFLVVEEWIVP